MNGSTIELRANGESGRTLEGYASTFRVWYPIGVGVEERMRSGAFARSLAQGPAVALRVEHSALPLAHTKGGTLELSEDPTGLLTVANLNPRDPDVQSLRAKAENSPLQMSFAFRCSKDSWNEDRSRREVIEAGLHKGDVSIVCYGANEATSLSIDERAGASSLEQRRAFAERIRGYTGGPKWGLSVQSEEPRGHATIAVPAPIHSYVETAKARRASARAGSVSARARTGAKPKATPAAAPTRSYVEQARAARAKLRHRRADAKPTATSAARTRTGDKAGRYSVERAKAARAKARRAHPGSEAHVAGHDNAPRYTEAQVDALGKRGLAHKRNPGAKPEYNFPIVDRRDLVDAIAAFGRALPSERASVKAFIKTRAILLRLGELLPAAWQSKAKPRPGPKEPGGEA